MTHEFLVTVFTMDDADNDRHNAPYADKHKNDFAIATNQNAMTDGSGITNGRDRTPWASPADFDKKSELLIALYENLSLVEVMRIMEEDHGFRATECQYKKRFSQWRREGRMSAKRYTPVELQAMSRKAKQRRMEGNKESALFYRGRHVQPDRIERFEKRNVRDCEIGQTSESQTPSAISCRTPSVIGASPPNVSDGEDTCMESITSWISAMIVPTKNNMANMSSSPSSSDPADSLPKKSVEQLPSEANFADDVFQSYVQELWEAYSASRYGPDSNERVQTAISQMIELLNNFSLIVGDLSFVSVDARDMYQLWELSNRLWLNHTKQARSLQKCLEKCAGRLQLEQPSSALITSNKSGAGLLSAELGYIAPVEQSKHLAFCCQCGAGPYMWPFNVGCVMANCIDHKFCRECLIEFNNLGEPAQQANIIKGRPKVGDKSLNALRLSVG